MKIKHLALLVSVTLSGATFALDADTKQKINNNIAKLNADMAKFKQERREEYVTPQAITTVKDAISKAQSSCLYTDSAKQDAMDKKATGLCDAAIKEAQKGMIGLFGTSNPKVQQATASAVSLSRTLKPAGEKPLLQKLREDRDKLVAGPTRVKQVSGDIEGLNAKINAATESCLDGDAEKVKKMTQMDQTRCTKALEIAQKAIPALDAKWKVAPKKL